MNYLDDCGRSSKTILKKKRTFKSFKQVENDIISALNSFLRCISKSSPRFGLQIEFPKNDSRMSPIGFFGKNNLSEMLDASGFDKGDQISFFLGSVVDELCGNEDNANATAAFSLCVDMASFIFRHQVASFWTEETLLELDEKIKEFKMETRKVFENYQTSRMRKHKWLMLEHVFHII